MVLALLSRSSLRTASAFSTRTNPALRRIGLSHAKADSRHTRPPRIPLLDSSSGKRCQYRRSSTLLPAINGQTTLGDDEIEIAEEVYLDDVGGDTISLAPFPNNDLACRSPFEVTAPFEPQGDQPEAIEQLVKQLQEGDRFSVLQGITGKPLLLRLYLCKLVQGIYVFR